jgi:hypothetical protein
VVAFLQAEHPLPLPLLLMTASEVLVQALQVHSECEWLLREGDGLSVKLIFLVPCSRGPILPFLTQVKTLP